MSEVLFIPGALGGPTFWSGVAERLGGEVRARYFGSPTQDVDAAYSTATGYDQLADRVAGSLRTPTHLVAQSLGCVLAALVAVRHPDKVGKLVLTGMSAGIDTVALGGVDWTDGFIARHPQVPRWVVEQIPDLTARLPALTAPTLLVCGSVDPISPVAVNEALRELIPHSRLSVVDGGAHDVPTAFSAETAALIRDHLTG